MFNHDAGHSHLPAPGFVTGCPLCDTAKTARNQAIAHYAEALRMLADLNQQHGIPTIRVNIAPIGLTGDDVDNCHSIDIPAKLGEALADAADSMNAYLGSEAEDQLIGQAMRQAESAIPVDQDSLDRRKAAFEAWMEGQAGEVIESGEWSAAAVAQNDRELYAEVTDIFEGLDLIELTRDVLDEPVASKLTVTLALDSLLGETGDTFEDEEGEL
ncbi:hypothetical protein ABZ784_29145 [Streptomyces tendae]|uniref:hypothetical protein n=1 Tax=Streptomyces tendae TaxID=1932 RepID=UPI0033E844E8